MGVKENLVIFDIDGVIYNYPDVIPQGAFLLYAISKIANKVVFLTGRSRYEEEETRSLLSQIGIPRNSYEIFMKPTKGESTIEFKKKFLSSLDSSQYFISIIEDDENIIQYARSLGIYTLLHK